MSNKKLKFSKTWLYLVSESKISRNILEFSRSIKVPRSIVWTTLVYTNLVNLINLFLWHHRQFFFTFFFNFYSTIMGQIFEIAQFLATRKFLNIMFHVPIQKSLLQISSNYFFFYLSSWWSIVSDYQVFHVDLNCMNVV